VATGGKLVQRCSFSLESAFAGGPGAGAALRFLVNYGADVVEPIWSIERLSGILLLLLMVGTALAFQLPVLAVAAGAFGLDLGGNDCWAPGARCVLVAAIAGAVADPLHDPGHDAAARRRDHRAVSCIGVGGGHESRALCGRRTFLIGPGSELASSQQNSRCGPPAPVATSGSSPCPAWLVPGLSEATGRTCWATPQTIEHSSNCCSFSA